MHPQENPAPGHSTGPPTEAGKAVSSMNRLTHGCRSEQVILRHEDPAEYTAVMEGWFRQYSPQTPAERLLVDQTAHAEWFLRRAQRRFDEVDYEKNMHFRHWTESQNREYTLALRYKTAAERALLRWFKELESYYARMQRQHRLEAQGAIRPFRVGSLQAQPVEGPFRADNMAEPEPVKTSEKQPETKLAAVYPVILPNFPVPSEFFFSPELPPRDA
jgi:hypothetical protein